MRKNLNLTITLASLALILTACPVPKSRERGVTLVEIQNNQFLINGKLTYEGRTWNGFHIEGLFSSSPRSYKC